MTTYKEFHGEVPITDIGKRLREIVKAEKTSFKILTGYGSTSNSSKSKNAAIKSLSKLKNEELIKGFLPGEVKNKLFEKGVLCGVVGNTLRILPPLILTKEQVDEFTDILKEVLEK